MTNHNEKLSAVLDDYQHTEEDQSVLKELQEDVNQQYTLQRYQMIGDVMRNDMPDTIQPDFVAGIRARLEQETAHQAQLTQSKQVDQPSSGFWSNLFKPVAGLAVAATVAVITVTTFQSPSIEPAVDNSIAVIDENQARVEQLAGIPVISQKVRVSGSGDRLNTKPGMNWNIKRDAPEMQNKLNTYLINHNEYSNSMHGIIPQMRVVGFDGQ